MSDNNYSAMLGNYWDYASDTNIQSNGVMFLRHPYHHALKHLRGWSSFGNRTGKQLKIKLLKS